MQADAQRKFPSLLLKLERELGRLWRGLKRHEVMIVFLLLLAFVPPALLVIWILPQWQVSAIPELALDRHSPKYFEIENEARRTIAQVILAVFSVFALFLAWRRAHNADSTLRITEQGHITDRFSKAVEMLGASEEGKPLIEVRIGAIFALERISIDSPRDYWTIVSVLAEYLSQHAKSENVHTTNMQTFFNTTTLRGDISAALTVLGRRRDPTPAVGLRLRLYGCSLPSTTIGSSDFASAQFINCDFNQGFFPHTDFSKSSLTSIDFRGCKLPYVNFDGTTQLFVNYSGATLERASFRNATLLTVDFRGAQLRSIDFTGASMDRVLVASLDLSHTVGLTSDMLRGTFGDERTVLPAGIERPKHWDSNEARMMLAGALPPLNPMRPPRTSTDDLHEQQSD